MWPNSCSTTQRKMRTMKSVLSSAALKPPRPQALKAIQARNRRKVIWILTAVPPKRPTAMPWSIMVGRFGGTAVIDQGTAGSLPHRRAPFQSRFRRDGTASAIPATPEPDSAGNSGKNSGFRVLSPDPLALDLVNQRRFKGVGEDAAAIGTAD